MCVRKKQEGLKNEAAGPGGFKAWPAAAGVTKMFPEFANNGNGCYVSCQRSKACLSAFSRRRPLAGQSAVRRCKKNGKNCLLRNACLRS